MSADSTSMEPIALDATFGYLDRNVVAPRQYNPQVILNTESGSMLRALREELRHCSAFTFSVAFVTPRAIALLKQELVEFKGEGRIITSDYLGFNPPAAFAELLNLKNIGIDGRLHRENAYHPKGYIFEYPDRVTAIFGSSNLTENALVKNHEWNLKVSATHNSDLAYQLTELISVQIRDSISLTDEWISAYTAAYKAPTPVPFAAPPRDYGSGEISHTAVCDRTALPTGSESAPASSLSIEGADLCGAVNVSNSVITPSSPDIETFHEVKLLKPNGMQQEALKAIDEVRRDGKHKAIVISATGTGKTILSALDVRAYKPERMLFVVHREQILDRAIKEFQRVLGASESDLGKLTGTAKQSDRRYVFATVQTLSSFDTLKELPPNSFDYILIDEVHRAGAASYARILEHFTPKFLLGMTATPERSDGFNVFELFDYNVPYEIRLKKALEDGMLSPFHYYGVTDVEFDDGSTTTDATDLSRLVSTLRVDHILSTLSKYTQAGIQPRGLIFCSRKEEAHALAEKLNRSEFRGKLLRTVALTGDDSILRREQIVQELENGELDYILTVDIFNEGVDIPSVNQVVMLRQTQSSIVFVQQLGRGLRLHEDKDYLVVIDFIGNYTNNYLIPIALFGDDSLNKESLRKNLIAAEEIGVLAGLSSVRFDEIAQARVLRSIVSSKLDSMQNLKSAIEMLRNRLGRIPSLHDFLRFESVDPVVVATKVENYPMLLSRLFQQDAGLSPLEIRALTLLSSEALVAKRPHELVVLRHLLENHGSTTLCALAEALNASKAPASDRHLKSALRTLTLEFYTQAEVQKYDQGIIKVEKDLVSLTPSFANSYRDSSVFRAAVDDIVLTGLDLIENRYDFSVPFTAGRQYSRKDACRLLCWDKNVTSTIYGYKVDKITETCPIFVTLHKSDNISASTAYEDNLTDRFTMRWYTRSKRTLQSQEVAAIVNKKVTPYVFAKKDDADGVEFYFLGVAVPSGAEQTTMPGDKGQPLSVVRMNLTFASAIETAVFDYFHPTVLT